MSKNTSWRFSETACNIKILITEYIPLAVTTPRMLLTFFYLDFYTTKLVQGPKVRTMANVVLRDITLETISTSVFPELGTRVSRYILRHVVKIINLKKKFLLLTKL
jgi:hypothetical protein